MSPSEKLILIGIVIGPVIAVGVGAWGKFLLDKPLQKKIHNAEAMNAFLTAPVSTPDNYPSA